MTKHPDPSAYLNVLPVGSVVLDGDGVAWQKREQTWLPPAEAEAADPVWTAYLERPDALTVRGELRVVYIAQPGIPLSDIPMPEEAP